MIGLGLDLCEIARMEKMLDKGSLFLGRYFTLEEQAYIQHRGKMAAQTMAAIYAAKEAFWKAIGTGMEGREALTSVAVRHADNGRPYYALTGLAVKRLTDAGGTRVLLSITHEAGLAAAVAIIE